MEYSVENKPNNVYVLQIKGDISAFMLQKLKDAVEELRNVKGKKNIVVNLAEVKYVDAFAFGIITAFARELRDVGGGLEIANMNDDIKLIFELSYLSKVYKIFDSVDAAEKSFL